jgi:ribosome-associated protein
VRKSAPRRASKQPVINPVETLLKHIEVALDDLKAEELAIVPLAGKATFADYLVIASGTSARHTASLADNVIKDLKKHGHTVYGVEGQQAGEWVCVDAGDVVVHIFQPHIRRLYNLEKLWSF